MQKHIHVNPNWNNSYTRPEDALYEYCAMCDQLNLPHKEGMGINDLLPQEAGGIGYDYRVSLTIDK